MNISIQSIRGSRLLILFPLLSLLFDEVDASAVLIPEEYLEDKDLRVNSGKIPIMAEPPQTKANTSR